MPVWTGQRVERTNVRGRHSYCAPFKAWIVEQAMQPGMSLAGLAMRNQVNANQLRRWVLLHQQRAGVAASTRLLPVTIGDDAARAMAAAPRVREPRPIEIEVAGVIVRVPDGASPASLRTVVDVLRGSAR